VTREIKKATAAGEGDDGLLKLYNKKSLIDDLQ